MGVISIHPIGRKVHIELAPVAEKKTEGGIVLPDKHSEPTRHGIVRGVGAECKYVKVDDIIIINFISGSAIDIPGIYEPVGAETDRIILEENILAILEETEDAEDSDEELPQTD